jgi:RNA polymerase sigma factor (TIGR02999 family)
MLRSPHARRIKSLSEPLASILVRASNGDAEARNTLFELLYADLRRRAHAELAKHSGNTLSTTALVHEAYLKLFDKELKIESRAHFFRLAARVMRQVLIDHVRTRERFKRGGAFAITSLDNAEAAGADQFPLIALDRALNELTAYDAALAELTELHVFAGLEFAEIAQLLNSSERSVYRDWRMARVFLRNAMAAESE